MLTQEGYVAHLWPMSLLGSLLDFDARYQGPARFSGSRILLTQGH